MTMSICIRGVASALFVYHTASFPPLFFVLLFIFYFSFFLKKKERNLQGTGRRVQSHASRSGHLAVVRCIVDLFQKCLQQLCGCPTIVCCHAAKVCCVGCGERNQKNMINGKM